MPESGAAGAETVSIVDQSNANTAAITMSPTSARTVSESVVGSVVGVVLGLRYVLIVRRRFALSRNA